MPETIAPTDPIPPLPVRAQEIQGLEARQNFADSEILAAPDLKIPFLAGVESRAAETLVHAVCDAEQAGESDEPLASAVETV